MVAEIAFRRSIPQRLEAAVIPQQLRHEWNSCPSRSCTSVGSEWCLTGQGTAPSLR
ncbi:MAG: hypothetical protein WCB56_18325 [Terriglobales bacterium]|jgi:hypothetical protein